MRKYKGSKLNKMLLLIAAIVMVLLLSGCRTRISNNTEVTSTISDEEGWLQESYQLRRDELGMPVAKKPFFTGGEQDEFDDYSEEFDKDLQELDQYEYEPEDEDLDDDNDDSDSGNSQTANNSSSAERSPRSATPKRKTGTTVKKKTSTAKEEAEAESDPNANANTNTTPNSNTNNNPDPPQEQPAPQEQQEQPKNTYTVSFDGNGVDMGGATISVEEGGKYGSLPGPPAKDGFTFDGWFTEKDGGKKVKEGDDFTYDKDQTLYAHWTKIDPVEIWSKCFNDATKDQTDTLDCQLMPDDAGRSTVEACKGTIVAPENGPKCIIFFAPKDNVTDAGAQAIFDQNVAANPALEKVIIISDDSISGNEQQKLFYKLVLLGAMHGKVGQETLNTAAADLGISEYWLAIYTRP